ncbi:MAG TPA: hypothetical protein VMN36_10790 [Verrucomicrobiales bacterium]|nr:hypothetical protein [Verrucomicrobiales bacterium]
MAVPAVIAILRFLRPAGRGRVLQLCLWSILWCPPGPLAAQQPASRREAPGEPAHSSPECVPESVLPHREEWPLLQEGLVEALALHAELLDRPEDSPSPALLLARASRSFLSFAPDALSARNRNAPSPAFRLSDEDFLGLLAGTPDPPVAAFSAFSGKWFGLWEGHPVDHDWSETALFEPPLALSHPALALHALQYAWIGDGFGWNVLVSRPDQPARRFILGAVYHIRDHDRTKIYLRRPHAGIAPDARTLIWITRKEVFFEEVPEVAADQERYFIHGFFYDPAGPALRFPRGGFSAAYGRDPDNRLPWLPLPFGAVEQPRDP